MKIHHAEEVASLLRHNIVQGVQEDDRWRTFSTTKKKTLPKSSEMFLADQKSEL
jgi:hypothetical protein